MSKRGEQSRQNFKLYGDIPRKNLKAIIERKGIKIVALARMANINGFTLHGYLRGEYDISLSNYISLLHALKIDRIQLYEAKK